MSSFIGCESGNRGRCKGPCRLPYSIVGANKNIVGANKNIVGANFRSPQIKMDGIKSMHRESAPYILSMKDMCALNSLQGLINAGVTSFKIEGRMRQADYVEGVTKTYRKYINAIVGANANDVGADANVVVADANVVGANACGALARKGEISNTNIEKDEKYLLELYNKGGFTNYYDKHNSNDMIQRYERK